MARLNAVWGNFGQRGQTWDHFWQDASQAAPTPADQPRDTEWDWSEQLSAESIPSGYQNSNATPAVSQPFWDGWDWSESVDDEWATDQPLQPAVAAPARQLSEDWDWSEPLTSESIGGGYQQADNAPVVAPTQNPDAGWDFNEQVDDEWPIDQTLSAAVVASPIQHTHSEWDWDEVLSPDIIVNGYQQADNAAIPSVGQPADLEWDFEAGSIDEDGWSNHFTNYEPIALVFDDPWSWEESLDDEWAADQSPYVAAVPPSPIQHTTAEWDWDEALYPELVVSGYQQADNAPAVSSDQASQTDWEFGADLVDEGGWSNHFTNYDPLSDQSIPDVWDWDERADDDWWTENTTVANVAVVTDPIQHTSAEWDWDEVLFSDVVVSGYQQADNAVVANSDQQPQTDWDFDSDFGGESGWNNHYTAYDPETQVFDDPWDWDESCEFEWQDESGPVVANNAAAISPIQHTSAEWDWDETVENEWQDYRDAGVVPDAPIVPPVVPPVFDGGGGRRYPHYQPYWMDKREWEKKVPKPVVKVIERLARANIDLEKAEDALRLEVAEWDARYALMLKALMETQLNSLRALQQYQIDQINKAIDLDDEEILLLLS